MKEEKSRKQSEESFFKESFGGYSKEKSFQSARYDSKSRANEKELIIEYHKNQKLIFDDKSRFKVIAKGRRFGLTKGFANYVIQRMLSDTKNEITEGSSAGALSSGNAPKIKVLWVDTIYANIERYIERYFFPVLKNLDRSWWSWRSIKNDLRILNSVCDFRSADRPENMEGFGYHLIIINEAGIILKNRKLWEESIAPMMLDYKAEVLIGGTPKGKRHKNQNHLFYELFKEASERRKEGWKSFHFTTYDNPLLDKEEIEQLEKDLPYNLRMQEIRAEFIDEATESIIKRNWWRFAEATEMSIKKNFGIYQSWDTAFKTKEENDYSVCTTWQISEDGYYLLDCWRDRVEFPELKKAVQHFYERYKPREVLIEDKASGQSLIQELQRSTRIPIKPIKVNADKIARVNAVTPLFESGKVKIVLPNSLSEVIINECEEFPSGEFDDIVDSVTQFLNYAKGVSKSVEVRTRKIKRERYVY